MKRGEIWLVNLDPVVGSEANKTRPAIIVSNDAANSSAQAHGRGVVTVVPVTSNVGRYRPFQVFIESGDGGLSVDSKAQAEQVRSVDYQRMVRKVGTLRVDTVRQVEKALRFHLGI